jgi:hypothetical protein
MPLDARGGATENKNLKIEKTQKRKTEIENLRILIKGN